MHLAAEMKRDVFNSTHFGKEMYNLHIRNTQPQFTSDEVKEKINEVLSSSEFYHVEHITAKVDTDKKPIVNALVDQGFRLTDTLVTYVFVFGKSVLPRLSHKIELGDCNDKDLKYLKKIALESFKIDRFHSDDSLPDNLCDTYYEKWIENSYNGLADRVIVARHQGEALGFTTAKVYPDDDFAHMVLSAVSDQHRGLGIYTSMIHEGTRWAIEKYADQKKGMLVGTQIDNIAVQKAWIKLGYTIHSSQYVLQIAK